MIRFLALAAAAFLGWRFLRRRSEPDEVVTIGWEDGSSLVLDPGAAERERLVALAREALQ